MGNNHNNKSHGLWSASFSTTLSISLVMFLLGFIFLFIYHAYNVSNEIKEQVSFTVYLNSGTSKEDAFALEKEIQQSPKVKSTKYISPDEAAQMMNKIMGDNHLVVLDSINPYQASIEVNLKAQSLNIAQIRQFILNVESKDIVDVVDYRHDLITDINNVIYNISAFIFVLFLCLLFIAITLINHTIRLSISNKRLQIRSMELIGAKPSFIRRPFIAKGFMLGLSGSVIADVLLAGVLFWAYSSINSLSIADHIKIYAIIGISIIILGTLLTLIFTSRSIRKSMNLKSSKLYR
jgi:cell division transport system permease protein